jgi:hypothetical protein
MTSYTQSGLQSTRQLSAVDKSVLQRARAHHESKRSLTQEQLHSRAQQYVRTEEHSKHVPLHTHSTRSLRRPASAAALRTGVSASLYPSTYAYTNEDRQTNSGDALKHRLHAHAHTSSHAQEASVRETDEAKTSLFLALRRQKSKKGMARPQSAAVLRTQKHTKGVAGRSSSPSPSSSHNHHITQHNTRNHHHQQQQQRASTHTTRSPSRKQRPSTAGVQRKSKSERVLPDAQKEVATSAARPSSGVPMLEASFRSLRDTLRPSRSVRQLSSRDEHVLRSSWQQQASLKLRLSNKQGRNQPLSEPDRDSDAHRCRVTRALVVCVDYGAVRAGRGSKDVQVITATLKALGMDVQNKRGEVLRVLCEETGYSAPTRENILRGIDWLVSGSNPDEILWFCFTGLGGQRDVRVAKPTREDLQLLSPMAIDIPAAPAAVPEEGLTKKDRRKKKKNRETKAPDREAKEKEDAERRSSKKHRRRGKVCVCVCVYVCICSRVALPKTTYIGHTNTIHVTTHTQVEGPSALEVHQAQQHAMRDQQREERLLKDKRRIKMQVCVCVRERER